MKKLIPVLLIIQFLLLSCDYNHENNTISIYPTKVINRFSDSTYFSNVTSITATDNAYFFSDMKNSRIVKTNHKLEVINSIGRFGEGPDEFVEAAEIYTNNNELYVFDEGNIRINYYKNDIWVNRTKVPYFGPFLERFYIEDDSLIVNSSKNESSFIYKFNFQGEIVDEYYFKEPSLWDNQTMIRAASHLFRDLNYHTIAIPINEPIVLMIDSSWNYHLSFSLANNPALRAQIIYMKNEYFKLAYNTTSILFEDACLDDNNNLFLLSYHLDYLNERHYNIVLRYKIYDNNIHYLKSYKLLNNSGGDWYNSFVVKNDTLVAFEYQNCEIHQFLLPE